MKIFYFIAFSFLLFINANIPAQPPNWEWAKNAGHTNTPTNQSVSTDAFGNVYVAGNFFSTTIVFGNDTLINLTNPDTAHLVSDIFITKYDSSGNVLWAKSAIGPGSNATSICTDALGDFYVTGYFSDSLIFGNTVLTNNHSESVFTAKFNSSGNVIWAKTTVTTSNNCSFNMGRSISTDFSGNVYITGYFSNANIIFDSIILINSGTTSCNWDFFIAKYDSAGGIIWAKNAGGYYNELGQSINADALGNIYVTGFFSNSDITFGNITLTPAINANCFIVKYDSTGGVVWANSIVGDISDCSLNIDISGTIYLTGGFSGTAVFGNDTLIDRSTIGRSNIFIAKYSSYGTPIWGKCVGGTNYDAGQSICTDTRGNIYATGYFASSSIVFGNDSLINSANAGGADVFVVKYDSTGATLWTKSIGGPNWKMGQSISANTFGDVYITGSFGYPEINFGNITLTSSNGLFDFYIAKLGNQYTTDIATENISYAHITVFPNPSTGTFNFTGLTPGSTIQIYNVLGEIIYNETANNESYRVSLNDQTKGIYFYRVSDNGNDVGQGKIVLE